MYGFKWLYMTHFLIWWTWYCPTQKKSTSDVASIFKQVSGGVLMRTLVIRLGQDLILQANDYCDRTTDGGILAINSPFSRGKLCSLTHSNGIHAFGFLESLPVFANRKVSRSKVEPAITSGNYLGYRAMTLDR